MHTIIPNPDASTSQIEGGTAAIFVNYNTSDQIIRCLNSLKGESLSVVIVVDNASPRDNVESITELYKDVVLIKQDINVGFGEGCNIGARWALEHTAADYILFLNPDTVIEPGLVNKLKRRFSDPLVGVVAPRITMMDELENVLWYGGGYINWSTGSAKVPGCGLSSESKIALSERKVEFVSGCAFIIRCDVLRICGGFDNRYFMYEEDVELSLRIRAAGYLIHYVPSALVRHRAQGSQGPDLKGIGMFSGSNPKLAFFVYHSAKNRFLTVHLHGSLAKRMLFLFGFLLWVVRRSPSWIKYRRGDAIKALIRGIKDFYVLHYTKKDMSLLFKD